MSLESKIEWTDATWNPTTGCKKVSPGCRNCYAETFAERFRGVKGHPFEHGFDLRLWESRLSAPAHWKSPKIIFVNSMSDLFMDEIPDSFIENVFDTMMVADHHIYQVLTKRPKRMVDWVNQRYRKARGKGVNKIAFPEHIWLGVSVESEIYKNRISILQQTPAPVKFISFEPLLGEINLTEMDLHDISWAIVGGESGHRARMMKPEWVIKIKEACEYSDVAFFFKQWGAFNEEGEKVGKKKSGRILFGKTWDAMPTSAKKLDKF
jgi:protein gp37